MVVASGYLPANPWKHKKVHRILTFCEHGMSEKIVGQFRNRFESAGMKTVLDPFVGSGTVAVEASKFSKSFVGQDANPFAILVSQAKCRIPNLSYDELTNIALGIRNHEVYIPSTSLARYHTRTQLKALGRIRGFVDDLDGSRDLGLVVLARLSQKHSRLRRSPAPRFRDNRLISNEEAILNEYARNFNEAIGDLQSVKNDFRAHTSFRVADSSSSIPKRFDAILSSPPFANNIDYVRHTQLELLWTGFADGSEDMGRLRSSQIPACEASARSCKRGTDKNWILRYLSNLPEARNYKKFLSQYFFAMNKHLELVADSLAWEAWYTIGDSRYKDCYIPTHRILAKLARDNGMSVKLSSIGNRPAGRMLYLLRLFPR